MTPIREELVPGLDTTARSWLNASLALAEAAAEAARARDPETPRTSGPDDTPAPADNVAFAAWELRFAAAGRHCGQERADSVRVLLLRTARADLATLTRLYQQGSAAERRAVLLALPERIEGPAALPLTEDALRTNDTRLVAAAVGPYATAHLDPHAWRHAVLKCLFTGVPLDAVDGLATRAPGDAELARMLADFAAERTAAGRTVPADLPHALHLTGEES